MNRKNCLPFFITKNAAFNIVPFVDSHHFPDAGNTTKTAKRKQTDKFFVGLFV